MPHEDRARYRCDRVQPSEVGAATAGQLVQPVDALDLTAAEQRNVQRHQGDGHQHCAHPIDPRSAGRSVVVGQRPPCGAQTDECQWHVQPELPLPRQEPHQHRAIERAPHPAERLDRAERAECPRATPLGIDITDHRQRHRHHRTTADGRQDSADQERSHRRGGGNDDGADDEQHVGRDEGASPPDDVADPSGDRHDCDEGDQVHVDDPRRVVQPVGQRQAEIADDRAQHRGDHGQVVGGDEHAEADGGQDGARRRCASKADGCGAVSHLMSRGSMVNVSP